MRPTTWVLSAGVEHYLTYRQLMSYRAEMTAHPELYSRAMAEPMFGVAEFFMGYPARLPAPDLVTPVAVTPTTPPLDTASREGPQPLSQEQIAVQSKNLALSAVMAVVIASPSSLASSSAKLRPAASFWLTWRTSSARHPDGRCPRTGGLVPSRLRRTGSDG
ncbi:MAG: hypothetical protein WCG80_09145 [Spirochaetales bacterium]